MNQVGNTTLRHQHLQQQQQQQQQHIGYHAQSAQAKHASSLGFYPEVVCHWWGALM
jgi:hypothetical protein